jgi:hypothetical protein
MEEHLVAARAHLRRLLRTHPDWPYQEYAEQVGRPRDWVKRWVKRLRAAPADDEAVLWNRSSARHHLPPPLDPLVIDRILEIRDHPPEHVQRTPGPKAILYSLRRKAHLLAQGLLLPRSTRTIWQILTTHERIVHCRRREHVPLERPGPLESWPLDFKDAASVPPDPDGKQQHVVETLDIVDVGTSLALTVEPGEDYTAETVFGPIVETLRTSGLPDLVGFDRDPRFVGSASGRDFPSPCMRFWQCLGVEVSVGPPKRPDKKALVERFHCSLGEACLDKHCPTDVGQVREVTAASRQHDNEERPNQAKTCGNRPPRVAFPEVPVRPAVPLWVDPDAWVLAGHGEHSTRTVDLDGGVKLGNQRSYVQKALAGTRVVLEVDAAARELVVWQRKGMIKRVAMKG